MKKFFSFSALCLGLAGLAVTDVHAQSTLYITNFGPLLPSGYPGIGNGFISAITPVSGNPTVGGITTFASGLNGPSGILNNGAGNLVFGSGIYQPPAVTGSILRIPLAGGTTTTLSTGGSNLVGPQGLALGPLGNIYNVNGYFTNPSITITPAAGGGGNPTLLTTFPSNTFISGIAYSASDNNLYVSAQDGILRVNASTGATSYAIQNGANPLIPTFNFPTALTFGPDGALYVSNNGNDNILKVTTPTLALPSVSVYAANPNAGALLDGPEGLGFDGNVLFVASDTGYVTRITPDNALLTTGTVNLYANLGTDSNPAFLTVVSPVPEPSTYAMFGVAAGLVLTVGLLRRRQMTLKA